MLEKLESLYFKAPLDNKNLRCELCRYLKYLGIRNDNSFDRPDIGYYISYKARALHSAYIQSFIKAGFNEISADTVAEILREECINRIEPDKWYLLLRVGDKVTITKRTGRAIDYPYDFANAMADLSGSVFTIKDIRENFILSDQKELLFFNGDTALYKLVEVDAFWHSSMFVPTSPIPIEHIELSEIKLII